MADQTTSRRHAAGRDDEPPTLVVKRGVRAEDHTQILRYTPTGTTLLPRVKDEPPPEEPTPTAAPGLRIPGWKQWLLFLAPAVVCFAIGWQGVGQRNLWNDEYATYHAATLSFDDLFKLLDNVDRVLGLYYVFMHGWMSVAGDSIAMLRLPSVVAMAFAAGFVALVGQRLLNTNAGLVAGLVFALIPTVTRYSQEARSYAFAVAFAALATWLLMIALERPVWGFWLLYAVAVGLTAAFHLISVLILFPHILLTWFRYQRSDRDVRLWKSLGALALIASLAMPMAYAGSGQSDAIGWIKADRHAVMKFPADLFGSKPAAIALIGVGLLAVLILAFAKRGKLAIVFAVWTLVPPVFTFVTHPLLNAFLFRYLLFTLIGWALLAAGGIYGVVRLMSSRSWPQLPIAAAVIAALVLVTLPAQHALRESVLPGESDFAAAAKTVAAGSKTEDGIAYAGNVRALRRAMEYEMRSDTTAWPADMFEVKTAAERGDFGAEECAQTLPCVGKRNRIWLVNTSKGDDPWVGMKPERSDTLRRLFKVSEHWNHQEIHIYLLVRRTPVK
ncbi:glycosyltransferase family 39 protein [Asanoa sp. NPDC050611]|uniref:glycosyltransferase family 39 protein n=1 Tax=Asanoa sp. NPDC050611 TaxID=3157098 RepID=UPI0033FF1D55